MSNDDFKARFFQWGNNLWFLHLWWTQPSIFFEIRYIDEHKNGYIKRLSDAVSIPSISALPDHRPEVVRMVHWTKDVRSDCLQIYLH